MKEIKWAVLGCGVIANEMAVALQKNGKNIYAVGNRTHEKAAAFAEKYGIGKVYDDFHEMFTDPEVDVIYITTPHNTHLGFMKEAIANGKHILVEKSITLNSDELDEAIALAKEKDVVMDGRDIGTKVLPGAFFKIFMTASSSVRAKRRYDELIARGVECDYNTILSDIEHRDYEDENRELAPLKQASDAIVIDTSDMTIEEASDKITELFKNKKEEYERNHKG